MLNLLKNFISNVTSYCKESSKINVLHYNKYHVYTFGWVALFAHPIFYLLCVYLNHLADSIYLRGFGSLTAATLLVMIYNKKIFEKYIAYYWIFMVSYNLPFFFTFNLLNTNFSDIWLMAQELMICVVTIFIANIAISSIIILLGCSLAALTTKLLGIPYGYDLHLFINHLPIYLLALVTAHIFAYASLIGQRDQLEEKIEALHILAATIAHEMRNPFMAIQLAAKNNKEVTNEIVAELNNFNDSKHNQTSLKKSPTTAKKF